MLCSWCQKDNRVRDIIAIIKYTEDAISVHAAECMRICTKKRLFIDYHNNSDNHDYVSGSESSALCRNAVRANIRNTTPPISVTIYKVGGKGFI